MFGSKKIATPAASQHTLISRGTKIKGDIHFSGELQIEGKIVGNVIAEGGTEARLVIHEKGFVEGEVRVPTAVINGDVTGDVRSTKHLELAAAAVIRGNVYYNAIEMVNGSRVNGNLVYMEESVSSEKKSSDNIPLATKTVKTPVAKSTAKEATPA